MYEHKVIERRGKLTNIIDTALYAYMEQNATEAHCNRVSMLCKALGLAMELPDSDIHKLEVSGLFHDIGKLMIQEQILNKSGPLTNQEWDEIICHPEVGYRILNTSIEMSEIADYVLYHHEWYDGTGYPGGLKAEEIPLLSRIISVVDSYDAMTNQRSYKDTLDQSLAVKELVNNKGKQFDPDIVDVFIEKVLNNKI